jgi:CubicO group peptidase (beta-lactamase class C family)
VTAAVQLDHERVGDLAGRIRHEIDAGRLPAAQVALGLDGRVAWTETFGAARPGDRFPIFSVTKGLMAAAFWTVLSEGTVTLDTPVADVVPEFAANGKGTVTIEHLLVHTAGFPDAPMPPADWADHGRRLARMAAWRLDWEPGTRCRYHATSAMWVLAEVLERADGRDFREAVHARLTAPLGLRRIVGVPPGEQQGIVDVVRLGERPTAEELRELAAALSGGAAASLPGGAVDLPAEANDATLLAFNTVEHRAAGVPGAGGIATAADIALVYQALLHGDPPLWDPEVLADGTGHVRCDLVDPVRGVAAHRSAGMLVAGDDGAAVVRGFGIDVSPRAFGHDGAGGQLAFADPDTGLSVCFLTNGLDRNPLREGRRKAAIATRAARCARR